MFEIAIRVKIIYLKALLAYMAMFSEYRIEGDDGERQVQESRRSNGRRRTVFRSDVAGTRYTPLTAAGLYDTAFFFRVQYNLPVASRERRILHLRIYWKCNIYIKWKKNTNILRIRCEFVMNSCAVTLSTNKPLINTTRSDGQMHNAEKL